MNSYSRIAVAVAAVLGTAAAGSAFAATNPPTPAQAASAAVKLYVAGSSAAKNGILGVLQGDLCGGASNALTFSSATNKNFYAVSCAPAAGVAGADGNTYYTVYYRVEGGSVSGALPIANGVAIDQLNLSDSSVPSTCTSSTACAPVVTGTSAANGTTDTFGGPVTNSLVQVGILDVEPGALIGANYPTQYSTSVWGPVNPAGVASLASVGLFDEVYGFFVNTSSGTFPAKVNLSKQTLNQIFTKTITNWNLVTDAVTGLPVSSSSLPITLVNREAGSGSRAATDLLIGGDTCSGFGAPIKEQSKTGFTDYFSTGDVLTAANGISGAITYATIENSASNLSLVQINGIAPSNLAAATGQYDFWVEAQAVVNPNISNSTAVTNLISFFTTDLQQIAKMPHLADVLAIPSGTNVASANVVSTANTAPAALQPTIGAATIYVNPFTRGGVTCNLPASTQ